MVTPEARRTGVGAVLGAAATRRVPAGDHLARRESGASAGETIIFVANAGDLEQPLTGKPQPPAPLDGASLPMDSPEDRRAPLANWLVSRDNPYFSRSIANRIWANFMGVGLVEAVDDMRVTNPASTERSCLVSCRFKTPRVDVSAQDEGVPIS